MKRHRIVVVCVCVNYRKCPSCCCCWCCVWCVWGDAGAVYMGQCGNELQGRFRIIIIIAERLIRHVALCEWMILCFLFWLFPFMGQPWFLWGTYLSIINFHFILHSILILFFISFHNYIWCIFIWYYLWYEYALLSYIVFWYFL